LINHCGADAHVRAGPPWSGSANALETEADAGVGRGPGGTAPHRDFPNAFLTQDTSDPSKRSRPFAPDSRQLPKIVQIWPIHELGQFVGPSIVILSITYDWR